MRLCSSVHDRVGSDAYLLVYYLNQNRVLDRLRGHRLYFVTSDKDRVKNEANCWHFLSARFESTGKRDKHCVIYYAPVLNAIPRRYRIGALLMGIGILMSSRKSKVPSSVPNATRWIRRRVPQSCLGMLDLKYKKQSGRLVKTFDAYVVDSSFVARIDPNTSKEVLLAIA